MRCWAGRASAAQLQYGDPGGGFVWVRLPEGIEAALLPRAEAAGVPISPVCFYRGGGTTRWIGI